MSRFFPVLLLICIVAGAIIGWNNVPHYRPPSDNGEARLRERASQYYKASRLFDSLTMAQLYSPPKQLNEKDDLLKKGESNLASFQKLEKSNQDSLHAAAESISPESLDVDVVGDWATTWGECTYPTEDSEVSVPLDKMVWVKSAGDWWIFTWTLPEIAAYGNPPDESYALLQKRRIEESRQLAAQHRQAQQVLEPETAANTDGGNIADEGSPQNESEIETGDVK